MPEVRRSTSRDFLTGAGLGFLGGLIVKELDLTTVVSYWGERSLVVLAAVLVGGVAGLTRLRKLVALSVAALAVLWLTVAFSPLTHFMAEGLARRDPVEKADAVFVLASDVQSDGDLTPESMSRLVRGLELLGGGWAPRLILSELPPPHARYRDAACELMASLGLEQEVLVVGPTRSTHDEAVAVAEASRDWGFEHILVVTSPGHSRRAAAALEAEGLRVTSVPSQQTRFNYEDLNDGFDDRIEAFPALLHEHAGLLYYRLRGWIS